MQVDSEPRAGREPTPPCVDDTTRDAPPAPTTPQPPAAAPTVGGGGAFEPVDAGIATDGGGVARGD
eukprot:14894298-Alexandrium_andersonii.AAC.1